jgi:hypothetical protein
MDEEDQNYLMDRLAAALIADDYSRAKKASVAAAVRSCPLSPAPHEPLWWRLPPVDTVLQQRLTLARTALSCPDPALPPNCRLPAD